MIISEFKRGKDKRKRKTRLSKNKTRALHAINGGLTGVGSYLFAKEAIKHSKGRKFNTIMAGLTAASALKDLSRVKNPTEYDRYLAREELYGPFA